MELHLCNLDKFTRLMYPLNQTAIPVVPAETEQPNAEVAAGNIEIRIAILFGCNLQCRAHDSLTTILETFRSHGVVTDMNSDLLLNPKECVYLFLNKTIWPTGPQRFRGGLGLSHQFFMESKDP